MTCDRRPPHDCPPATENPEAHPLTGSSIRSTVEFVMFRLLSRFERPSVEQDSLERSGAPAGDQPTR
jgi:hypothetical protein